jgi:hypothetical protein
VDELLRLSPDVLAYYPLVLPGEMPVHVETLCRFLGHGVNVVAVMPIATGRCWGAEERFNEAGKKGNASLFVTGAEPGYIHALMLTATGVCQEVRKITMFEEAEASAYESPGIWDSVGMGHLPDEPGLESRYFRDGTRMFEDWTTMMADALEVRLDEVRCLSETALATKDLDLGYMLIKKGHIAGVKIRWVGISNGKEVIEHRVIWKLTEDMEPNWEVRYGHHIQIDGTPNIEMSVIVGVDSAEMMNLQIAMPSVLAIPDVVKARPGVVTFKDLPPIAAARRVVT